MVYYNIFVVILIIGLTNCEISIPKLITPCKKGDVKCMTASSNAIISKVTEGFPDQGIHPLEPLTIEEIVGNLSTLKFTFTNTTVTGLKNCHMVEANMNVEESTLRFVLHCKNIVLKGQYALSGQLITLPVQGDGDYKISAKIYKYEIDAELKEFKGSDGKQRVAVKKYQFKAEPLDNIAYDFKNLFNGQKELADTVIKFANENWKEVADFVQEPVIGGIIKKLISNLNKFLKFLPVDDMFLH